MCLELHKKQPNDTKSVQSSSIKYNIISEVRCLNSNVSGKFNFYCNYLYFYFFLNILYM